MAQCTSPARQQIEGTASSSETVKKTRKSRNTRAEPPKLPPDSYSKSLSSPTVDTFEPEREKERKLKWKTKAKRCKEEAPLFSSLSSEKVTIASHDSNNPLEGEIGRIEERRKRKRIKEETAMILADSGRTMPRESIDFLDREVGERKKKRNTKNEDIVAEVSEDSVTMRTRKDDAERPKQLQGVSFNKENGGAVSKCENNTDEGGVTIGIHSDKDMKSKKKKLGWKHIHNGSVHQEPETDGRNEKGCPSGTEKDIRKVVSDPLGKREGVLNADSSNNSHRIRGERSVPEVEDQNNLNSNKTKKKKKVSFEDQHINQPSDVADADNSVTNDGGVEIWGVRFTPEENEILKQSVFKYIKEQGWDEQAGLQKVLNCRRYKEARNCWHVVKASLPNRPREAIRLRAHRMLEEGTHLGRWSQNEEELLKSLQAKHGKAWKRISSTLGRNRYSIYEKWRSLKRGKATGKWLQKELQQLSDLVHKHFRRKALLGLEKKLTDRHILRDDINWEKIADDIGTHDHGSCCGKWYYSLCSSMVSDGIWANEDDIFLLKRLLESGACAEEEVEWNKLLAHRAGNVCLTRWKQMGKHLGENTSRPFLDKLDILVKRYAPELLENDNDKQENLIGLCVV